jgi:DNA polymerase IV
VTTERTIFHVDMDAFYASVEQRDHPEYQGKPVIVGADPREGRGRGVVAACSYEARRFGIHSALPISQAWRLCPRGIYVRPNMARYKEASRAIRTIFHEFTELVEPLSIDEAFLDVSRRASTPEKALELGRQLKDTIWEQQKLKASIGIAPNKFAAKIASDLEKPDALVMVRAEDLIAFLEPLPISRLWGVGPRTEEKLHRLGLRTIGQIRESDPDRLVRQFGRLGNHLWQLANGYDDRPVVVSRTAKSISQERTFPQDTRDPILLRETLRALAGKVAARLKREGATAGTVVLKLRYSDFTTFTRQATLRDGLTEEDAIFAVARRLLRKHWNPALKVRLIGVGVSGLRNTPSHQLKLFSE